MSDALGRDTRPLVNDQELQDSQFTETDILERLRDGSPRYGTFVEGSEGRNNHFPVPTPILVPTLVPTRHSQPPLVATDPSMRTPLNTTKKRYRLSFLILISFDVTLVVFLSIMCFLTSNPNDHSVSSYFSLDDIDISVFDLVLLSIIRFVFDLIFYLVLGWVTRLMLFITTLVSTVYVPIKAFFYWEHLANDDNSDVILYIIALLLLFSAFATPWLIAFFFEFKYLPTERARLVITTWFSYKPWLCPWLLNPKSDPPPVNTNNQPTYSNANPVIRQYLSAPSTLNRHQSLDTVFRTPVGSIRGSPTSFVVVDDDLDTIREEDRRTYSPELLPAECDQYTSSDDGYCQLGNDALQSLVSFANTNNGWTQSRQQDNIHCYSLQGESRKIWKVEMIVPVSVDRLWTILYYNVESTKEWNTGIALNEIIQRIDHNTDIIYTLCTTIGPVSPRDFVTVRRWGLVQGVYYGANISTTHNTKPPQRDPVRGENGPCGYVVVPIEDHKCKFIWMLNSDLKGWIPQSVLDQIVPNTLVNTCKTLRNYACR